MDGYSITLQSALSDGRVSKGTRAKGTRRTSAATWLNAKQYFAWRTNALRALPFKTEELHLLKEWLRGFLQDLESGRPGVIRFMRTAYACHDFQTCYVAERVLLRLG